MDYYESIYNEAKEEALRLKREDPNLDDDDIVCKTVEYIDDLLNEDFGPVEKYLYDFLKTNINNDSKTNKDEND